MSCHSFIFFNNAPSIAGLSAAGLESLKEPFVESLEALPDVTVSGYKTLGLRRGTRFMLHLNARSAEAIERAVERILHTELGRHLEITYTLLGLTRPSQYRTQGAKEEKPFADGAMRYLIVYPFTKTAEWHQLPFEERRELMKEHVMVAKQHSGSINQLLLYAYGIDDHEFIVTYQTDSLKKFQDLVIDLRSTKGRAYTQNDLPIFTCVHASLKETLGTV